MADINTSWEGHTGAEVESWIRAKFGSKVGLWKIVQDLDSNNVIVGFASEDEYDEWDALSDENKWGEVGIALMVTKAVLPSVEGSDTYSTSLTLQSTPETIQATRDVVVNVKASSTVTYAAGGTENIMEDVAVQIQTRTSSNDSWTTRAEVIIPANESSYREINLRNYLFDGTNYVRMRAVGEYASSIWRSFTLNVVALSLVPNTSFEVPFTGNSITLNYKIGGTASKILQLQFGTGTGMSFVATYTTSQNVGTIVNTTTGISYSFDNENVITEGVHTVRARLYVSETVHTDWIESQYIMNNTSGSTPYVIVNDVTSVFDNWTEVKFFDFAVYTGGAPSINVHFILRANGSNANIASWEYNAVGGMSYSFNSQLGIELDSSITTFYGNIHIEDGNGNAIANPVPVTINNSDSNTPTSGADFILNPSLRSNSESTPNTIINSQTGAIVNSTWQGFGFVSDGWVDVNKDASDASKGTVRALHIPAGRSLTIGYNPFVDFMSNNSTGKYMTMEIDFRTSNILDEDEPIIMIGTQQRGFTLLPLEAFMMTQQKTERDNQNVSFAEDIRTHLAINVVTIDGLHYVRIFVNGVIDREFNYSLQNDAFVSGNVSIVMGNTSSDIDIFGIRCYRKTLSTEEVMQDYVASMPTVAEKVAFRTANDLIGSDGLISYTKALEKYNVLLLTGHVAKYGDSNKGKTEGNSLYIKIQGDPSHSGTLTALENSGQGTTAMTYYDWNQQQKITDDTQWIPDGETTGESVSGYAIQSGEALAKKLCGKINFASSMQSHKLGLTWIYNDLFKRLVNDGKISKPSQIDLQSSARIAVYEKPFLFFSRDDENAPITFRYLMTWGAGKGDKPTFGFNKNTTPDMMMVEGANNDRPLALFVMPWTDDVTYDPDEEAWMYAGQKQLNFGFGKTSVTDNKEYPSSTNAINAMKAFFNFAYLHNPNIAPFIQGSGKLSDLISADESGTVSRSVLWWVTSAEGNSAMYDLYRFDEVQNTFVKAGLNGATLNLRTEYVNYGGTGTWDVGRWDAINTMARNQRIAHFRANASTYVDVDDALYHSCFVKFFAATDNRAKNTYYYTDPVSLKVRFMQDDLDTTLKTNNVGQNRKPYYVEEHDKNADDEYYWQGEKSGFYNALEEAFPTEMRSMMYAMMSGMAQMGGSVMGFLEQYLLSTQDYFPAIAYNEQAKIVYEAAAKAQDVGDYTNAVKAITQSCGSQRWSEYDWLKNRVMYISSWCEYGEFAGSSQAPNGLSWRSPSGSSTYNFVLTPAKWLYCRVGNDSGNYPASNESYSVRVQAGQTINYRTISTQSDSWISIRGIDYYLDIGDFNHPISGSQGAFPFSGKKLQQLVINESASTSKFLATGVNITSATNIKRIVIRNASTCAGTIDLTRCTRLEEIDLRGTSFTQVGIGASDTLTSIKLPALLEAISLTAQPNLTELSFDGYSQLDRVEIDSAKVGSFSTLSFAQNIYAGKTPTTLSSAKFYNVEWTDVAADILMYLASAEESLITGSMVMRAASSDRYLTLSEVLTLAGKFGNIQDTSNSLYIDYPKRNITSIALVGEKYIFKPNEGTWDGTFPFDFTGWSIETYPSSGNNVKIGSNGRQMVTYALSSGYTNYATFTDSVLGHISVSALQNALTASPFALTITMTLTDNSTVSVTRDVGFYKRIPKLGDCAYLDGTFDNAFDKTKGLAGVVMDCKIVLSDGVDIGTREVTVLAKEDIVPKSSSDTTWLDNAVSYGILRSEQYIPNALITELNALLGVSVTYPVQNCGGNTIAISNDTTYIDDNTEDGYKVTSIGQFTNFKAKEESQSTLEMANLVITTPWNSADYGDGPNINRPTTIEELCDAIIAYKAARTAAGDTSVDRWEQLFFMPVYLASLYEPISEVGGNISSDYKKGKWLVPSVGWLTRILNFWWNSQGRAHGAVSSSKANENPATEARTPIFANMLARMEAVGLYDTAEQPFKMIVQGSVTYTSTSQMNDSNKWAAQTNTKNIMTQSKAAASKIRPITQFTFNL